MTRANGSHQKGTIVVILGVVLLFVLLILRNGGNYYMNYLHQDASRAQFEIDQSYVLLISQAEEGFSPPQVENQDRYNATLMQEFKNKFIQKPNYLVKEDFENAKKIEFGIYTWEDKALTELLLDKRDGFSIHCCHFDSESLSKVSKLKMARDWESVIMESDRKHYEALKSQARTYSIVDAILTERANFSMESLSKILKMKKGAFSKLKHVIAEGGLEQLGPEAGPGSMTVVPEIPLSFVAKTFGRTEVDLLALKAKGRELGILKAIVSEDCEVHIITVEFDNSGETIKSFLTQNGYKLYEVADLNSFQNSNTAVFYSEKAMDGKKTESVFPLLEELQKAKLNKS
ncbi:uncharacterized protein LOC116292894 [Actinia tenebrosa]|uniref:Uncharacterized protein LOC116292894 n=1 Tax=Actinia tenebrosa TaxID=6105 RepID=A0A6P8HM75_ACTTE|nr:uncharacterized protein LOC116292894 [Actinia tenebrosa]